MSVRAKTPSNSIQVSPCFFRPGIKAKGEVRIITVPKIWWVKSFSTKPNRAGKSKGRTAKTIQWIKHSPERKIPSLSHVFFI